MLQVEHVPLFSSITLNSAGLRRTTLSRAADAVWHLCPCTPAKWDEHYSKIPYKFFEAFLRGPAMHTACKYLQICKWPDWIRRFQYYFWAAATMKIGADSLTIIADDRACRLSKGRGYCAAASTMASMKSVVSCQEMAPLFACRLLHLRWLKILKWHSDPLRIFNRGTMRLKTCMFWNMPKEGDKKWPNFISSNGNCSGSRSHITQLLTCLRPKSGEKSAKYGDNQFKNDMF